MVFELLPTHNTLRTYTNLLTGYFIILSYIIYFAAAAHEARKRGNFRRRRTDRIMTRKAAGRRLAPICILVYSGHVTSEAGADPKVEVHGGEGSMEEGNGSCRQRQTD